MTVPGPAASGDGGARRRADTGRGMTGALPPPAAPRIAWLGEHPHHVRTLADWHVRAFADWVSGWQLDAAEQELRAHMLARTVPTTLVALDEAAAGDDALLGSVSLLASDRPAPDRHAPWLGSLYVRPDARQRGVGAVLVRAAVAEARRLGVPVLHLWTPAHAAFYARLGWVALGPRRYGGLDVTLMRIDCAAAT
jgi:GNAT superfamily N-acetyltransferase